MGVISSLLIILIASVFIYYFGNIFVKSSSKIGDYFHLSKSVKGATLDAVASSLPELFVGLFSVIVFKTFEVGIGTITGSALFNLLVIPGLCVLVAPNVFKISKEVISRDAIFYIMAVFILLVLVLYFEVWGMMIAFILLLTYIFYIKRIIGDTRLFRKFNQGNIEDIKFWREVIIFLFTMLVIGVSTYFLVEASIDLSNALKIPPIIIAFTITAAATSIPDTVVSIANAKKGDLDDATSNVFGSNIFDILIGLGLPLLIYVMYKGSVKIIFEHLGIILGLLGATIMLLYFFAKEHKLDKKQGTILLLMYLIFLGYILFIAFSKFF